MERKENVLIVHNFYKIRGGEDTVVTNEKKLLEEHGHKVVLYSRDNSELDNHKIFSRLLLPFASVFNVKTYRAVKKIIKKEKIDVVHVHNTLAIVSPAVYYAAKKMKVPVIYTLHNFRLLCPAGVLYRDGSICEDCLDKGFKCAVKHKCYRNSRLQTLSSVFVQKFHRFTGIYKKINYICLTRFNKEKMLRHGQISEDRIFIKPNFCESDGIAKPFVERSGFVFVGRLEEIKGVKFLLEAFADPRLSEYKLTLLGTGELEEYCKKYVADNGLKNVELRGFTPHDEVLTITSESKGLILPTLVYEGFPMTIVEAFSVGTPVICPDTGNAGDIVKDGVCGKKYAQCDKEGFINAVKYVDETAGLNETALGEYLNNYTAERNYAILSEIYAAAEENACKKPDKNS